MTRTRQYSAIAPERSADGLVRGGLRAASKSTRALDRPSWWLRSPPSLPGGTSFVPITIQGSSRSRTCALFVLRTGHYSCSPTGPILGVPHIDERSRDKGAQVRIHPLRKHLVDVPTTPRDGIPAPVRFDRHGFARVIEAPALVCQIATDELQARAGLVWLAQVGLGRQGGADVGDRGTALAIGRRSAQCTPMRWTPPSSRRHAVKAARAASTPAAARSMKPYVPSARSSRAASRRAPYPP